MRQRADAINVLRRIIMLDVHMRGMHIQGMTLDQYLTDNGITEATFAKAIDVDQSTVNRLRKGQVPNKALMAAIFDETAGAVRADDFFGLGEAPSAAA